MRTLENPGTGFYKRRVGNDDCNDVIGLEISPISSDHNDRQDTVEPPENEVGRTNEGFKIRKASYERGKI